MNLLDIEQELAKYVGLPKCQDCGWKLGTDITNNCACRGSLTPEQMHKYTVAFNCARQLQAMLRNGTNVQ